jgi:hypothetical protein
MRYVLLATTALVALTSSAGAQVIVNDPPSLIKNAMVAVNTAQEVQNGYTMIKGVIHGNGFAGLVPGLGSGLAANPISALGGTASSVMSGTDTGGLGGMFGHFLGQTKTYTPEGDDPEAEMLQQRASAAAGQMSVGQQFLNGTTSRLSLLPQLLGMLGVTNDLKDSMDANTRVNAEASTTAAQQTQLQALAIYQRGEEAAQRSREELAARKGADELVAHSRTAAANAEAGNVTLVTN